MCGPESGQVCQPESPRGGACCSHWGFCGNRPEYCGAGCQMKFSFNGQCQPQVASTSSNKPHESQDLSSSSPASQSTGEGNDRCGPKQGNRKCKFGVCCSLQGYCGKGPDYCTVPGNCIRGYGWCDDLLTPLGYNQTLDGRPLDKTAKIKTPIKKCTKARTLALSFDDGPTNYTESILDALRDAKPPARATFFLSGVTNGKGQLDYMWTKIVRRMIEEGHQVASHTWSHPHLDKLTSKQRKTELAKNERAIANIIGKYPTFIRAPYVECNKECQKDMKGSGYYLTSWGKDSDDWKETTTLSQMKTKFNKDFAEAQGMKDGSLFYIQHDTHNKALPFVQHALQMIKQHNGWSAVPLVECLGHKLDLAYRFPSWLDPLDVVHGGCLVSDSTNMCINLRNFTDKHSCHDAANKIKSQSSKCSTSDSDACRQALNIYDQLNGFCNQCDQKKMRCDMSRFKIEAWHPKY